MTSASSSHLAAAASDLPLPAPAALSSSGQAVDQVELQLVQALSPEESRKRFGQDAWNFVLRCILHACGNSYWKYSKPGVPPHLQSRVFPYSHVYRL